MSHDHDDYQSEPIRGLPERPPPGETILWQGSPSWWQLAKEVFHIRLVALYFAALMGWRAHARMASSGDYHVAIASILSLLPVALLGLGLLALLALLSSRTTVYTITSKRVVIRAGVAITYALNIPFKLIGTAALRPGRGGFGNIALTTLGTERLAYGTLWPHVRPWRLNKPEPMLRCIADAPRVADLLGEAVRNALPEADLAVALSTGRPSDDRSGRMKPVQGNGMGLPASFGLSS
jgi:hypothetical protein